MATNNSYCIFHPRQGERAEQLNQLLGLAGFNYINQPLFHVEAGEDSPYINTPELYQEQDCLIFTSQYAAAYLAQFTSPQLLQSLQHQLTIAVGQATADKLNQLGFTHIITPSEASSEGLLTLPELQNAQHAILFKGEQGRNHISDRFKLANKVLNTYNIYKRTWQPLTHTQLNKIATADCFVLTSGENANFLIDQANTILFNKLKTALCLVPSERVKQQLEQHGLTQVKNIHSANNHDILTALQTLNGNPI